MLQLADELRDALSCDIEQGIKWLSESKRKQLGEDWPYLSKWLDHFFDFAVALEPPKDG